MSKFTEGPWRYGTGNNCHVVYGKDGTKLCEVYENLADRFLIAKAPEMYDLVRFLADPWDESVAFSCERAKALIKEIEGGGE